MRLFGGSGGIERRWRRCITMSSNPTSAHSEPKAKDALPNPKSPANSGVGVLGD